MKKVILLILIIIFCLIATGAISVPNTKVDDAIASTAKRIFSPVGLWLMRSPGIKKVIGGFSSFVGMLQSIPGKIITGVRSIPHVIRRVGTNAKNSILPFWRMITNPKSDKPISLVADDINSNRSPLPLVATIGTLFALVTVRNKRLPFLLFLIIGTVAFIYYM